MLSVKPTQHNSFVMGKLDERLYVREISFGFAPPGYAVNLSIRSTWHLHFILSGSLCYDGTVVRAGSVFLMPPDVRHRFEVGPDGTLVQYWIEFGGSEVPALLERTCLADGRIVFDPEKTRRAEPLLHRAVYEGTGEGQLAAAYVGLLLLLIAEFPPADSAPVGQSRAAQYVNDALEYLHAGLSRGATVAEAAEAVGLSEKYLCKLFRQTLGVTPMESLTRLRFRCAQILLDTTEMSIAEVASAVGFDNPTYFSRFFRRAAGTSPTAYRKTRYPGPG